MLVKCGTSTGKSDVIKSINCEHDKSEILWVDKM